ncbi:MAG: CDP-archaeol synthase [Actinomycetia bacterium]|nr:CDP-archaeol synthase [Actinomycetes bacterium]MCP4227568.1 CDP-archaeol synthase [Actinomycetes bacterium]MCP5033204.1 CDP-archaeol synthase [Actinomycetes bacterium]
MADNKKRGRFSKGSEDSTQSIFDLFEPPPEQEASSFGRIPIIRDDDEESLDLTNVEYVEAQAAAEAEAAGLQHWTEPPTGQVPAALGADIDERAGEVSGPSWRGEDPNWAGPDLSDVFADTEAITHDRVVSRSRDEVTIEPSPKLPAPRRPAPKERPVPATQRGPAPSIFDDSRNRDPSNGRITATPADRDRAAPLPDPGAPNRAAPPLDRQTNPDQASAPVPASERRPAPSRSRARLQDEVRPNPSERPESLSRQRSIRPRVPDPGSEANRMAPAAADELEWGTEHDYDEDSANGIDQPAPQVRGAHDKAPASLERTSSDLASPTPRARRDSALDPEAQIREDPRSVGRPNLAEPDPRGAGLLQPPPEDDQYEEYEDFESYEEEESGGRNLGQAIVVGIALAALVAVTLGLGAVPTMIMIGGLSLLAVMELFNAMRLAGLRPATLLGLVGTVAIPAAAYVRGDAAYPLVVGLAVVFGMLWYLTGADTERPVLNLGLTLMGILWVGGLAGFGALLVRVEGGIPLLLTAIVVTAVSDTLAYLGGRAYGNKPFHSASPNKTWEGTLTGFFGALFAGLVLGVTDVISTFDGEFISVIVMAAVIGILAPIGDLAESLVKRDLGIKDMGTMLPGHGGVLDRLDGLLFALPGAYYVAVVFQLI